MAFPDPPALKSPAHTQNHNQNEIEGLQTSRFSGGNWLETPDCPPMEIQSSSGETQRLKCFSPFVRIRDSYTTGELAPLKGGLQGRMVRRDTFVRPERAETPFPREESLHTRRSPSTESSQPREPTALELTQMGLGLAVPEYALALFRHEGLHALFATAFGGRVTSFNMLPSTKDGHFRFGDVEWKGKLSPVQQTLVYLAPKFGDLLGLSVYGLLDATGNIPKSKYAQLVLLVVATGMWVDFSKDITATSDQNDVVRAYSLMGATSETARLPYRLTHAGLALGTGLLLVRGYLRLFGIGESSRETAGSKANEASLEGYVEGGGAGLRGIF